MAAPAEVEAILGIKAVSRLRRRFLFVPNELRSERSLGVLNPNFNIVILDLFVKLVWKTWEAGHIFLVAMELNWSLRHPHQIS